MRYVNLNRVRGLKALLRSCPMSAPASPEWQPPLVNHQREPHTRAAAVRKEPDRLAQILGATTKTNQYGEYLSLHCWSGDPPRYTPNIEALRLLMPGAVDEVADPEQWLFLDTETTGLAGGSGTYAFLVGIAWWEGGGLEIEQFFMREYSEERSLLFALRERIVERPVLVTFNGKSFDWPLLETRYRMSRKLSLPVPRAHLDFLHPARNLWRLRLGSVTLSELERHVLGSDRGSDVLSDLIPRIYLDFVRGGSPEALISVFHHNQMDLRSLAALSSRILSLLGDAENVGQDGFELFGVSRICERRGENARARNLYQKSIASVLPTEADRAARTALARLAKRDGDTHLARGLWESILGNSREGYKAYEQLAIHFEHKVRQPQHALGIVREALSELRRANQAGMISPTVYRRTKAEFEHRLSRLERKAGHTQLEAFDA
jgi:uncharacterized protein YprB with RNaseH-like and TPR domain